MFRFLVPPIVFALLKHFAITSTSAIAASGDSGTASDSLLAFFSSLTAEDTSQRDALLASVVFIVVTLVAALFVVSVCVCECVSEGF
jgi:hypothetical protein